VLLGKRTSLNQALAIFHVDDPQENIVNFSFCSAQFQSLGSILSGIFTSIMKK
jgi:hypothetical protein